MGWSVGWDSTWNRDIGYGVPALCDHPKCTARIDRGLAYVCCGQEPYGGDKGCGLFFCYEHQRYDGKCPRCVKSKPAYRNIKPDVREWIEHKLNDPSWAKWRKDNPVDVHRLKCELRIAPVHGDIDGTSSKGAE